MSSVRRKLGVLAFGLGLLAAVASIPVLAAKAPAGKPVWVAVDVIAPPFVFDQNGRIVGFDVDMIRAISKAAQLDLRLKIMPWAGIIPSLQAGSVDAAVDAITITTDRLRRVDFSDAYYRSGLSVLVRKGSAIRGFDDLAGHVVAVKKASSGAQYVIHHGKGIKFLKQFETAAATYQSLESGAVDAIVNDNPMNSAFAAKNDNVRIVGKLLEGSYYGIAVSRKHPELLARLNTGLAEIKRDGAYHALFVKWFGGDTTGAVMGVIKPADASVAN